MSDLIFFFSGSTGEIGLLLIFLFLFACGVGLPFPEEIGILAAGYLAHQEMVSLTAAILVPFSAILAGDILLFTIGNRMGLTLFEHRWFKRIINRQRLRTARRYFAKYGNRIVFFSRFITGLRAPIFLSAAILRMKIVKFIILDTTAAILSVPLLVYLAYYFGGHIHEAIQFVRNTKVYFLIILTILIALIALVVFLRKRSMDRDEVNPA